jgi:hypothetical protein
LSSHAISFTFQTDVLAEELDIKHTNYGYKWIGTRVILTQKGDIFCIDNNNTTSNTTSNTTNNNNNNTSNNTNTNTTKNYYYCPFVTPSLLCSNDDAFSHLSCAPPVPPVSSSTTISPSASPLRTSPQHVHTHVQQLPSLVGTNIDTALQLLYSIHMIELDYYNYYKKSKNDNHDENDDNEDENDNGNSNRDNNHDNDNTKSLIPPRLWNAVHDLKLELPTPPLHSSLSLSLSVSASAAAAAAIKTVGVGVWCRFHGWLK